jgi:hypothetical protein
LTANWIDRAVLRADAGLKPPLAPLDPSTFASLSVERPEKKGLVNTLVGLPKFNVR